MSGKFLHTMIRVRELEPSIAFYTNLLGMKELRRTEVPAGRYTLAFVGYASNAEGQAEIELTYNWDQDGPYDIGTAFGHLRRRRAGCGGSLRQGKAWRWQGDAGGRASEARHHGDCVRRGSGRLQDRADRAE